MQEKIVSVSKMRKNYLLFPLFLSLYLIVSCSPQFAPRPYFERQERLLVSHEVLVENFKAEIQKFYGAPYKWGGETPHGTDCSGMVKTIYRNALDIDLPHNAQSIYDVSKKIYKIDLQFGDLVFFSKSGRRVTHMGIYIDRGFFLHASSSRGVILSKLSESYYKKQFVGAGRIEVY